MNPLYLYLSIIFLLIFTFGKVLEKFRIPWLFSGLFVGILLATLPFSLDLATSNTFNFLAKMGMYFLLFIIGFEINFRTISKQNKPIISTTLTVLFFEVALGSVVLYYLFDLTWFFAFLVASSFATVGEAVLLPILEEFSLVRKKIGQRIISVGVLDDLFEIFVVVLASIVIGSSKAQGFSLSFNILLLFSLFLLVYLLFKLHNNIQRFKYKDINSMLLFIFFFIFLFVGIGNFIDSSSLGALLAGISLRNLVPYEKLSTIESDIKMICYTFFAPLFFVWVGLSLDFSVIISNIFPIFAIVVTALFAKVFGAFISSKNELGVNNSLFVGLALTVRMSSGIVVLSILLENGLISSKLFSILIGASIIFTIVVPLLLPLFISKLKIEK